MIEKLSLFFPTEKFTIKSDWNIYRKGEIHIAIVHPLATKNKLDNAFEKIEGKYAG